MFTIILFHCFIVSLFHNLLKVSRQLIAAGENVGCATAEELINLIYHDRLQDHVNALRVLQNRYDHLTQVKYQSKLDKSRQNLETPVGNAYHASGNADDFSSVESMIAEIGSSVTQISQR